MSSRLLFCIASRLRHTEGHLENPPALLAGWREGSHHLLHLSMTGTETVQQAVSAAHSAEGWWLQKTAAEQKAMHNFWVSQVLIARLCGRKQHAVLDERKRRKHRAGVLTVRPWGRDAPLCSISMQPLGTPSCGLRYLGRIAMGMARGTRR